MAARHLHSLKRVSGFAGLPDALPLVAAWRPNLEVLVDQLVQPLVARLTGGDVDPVAAVIESLSVGG